MSDIQDEKDKSEVSQSEPDTSGPGPDGPDAPRTEDDGAPKKKKKKWTIVLVICIVVVIIAVLFIVVQQVQRSQRAEVYEEMQQAYTVEEEEEEETEEPEEEEKETTVNIPIDFDSLQKENPDIYAWIRIKDTVIDYPVLQSADDDDYYLDHTVEGASGYPGSIYSQSKYNGTDMTDNVTVLYGHNMRDGSMFGDLSEYSDEEYREAHAKIKVYTPEHIFTYKVVFAVTYDNRHILSSFDTEEARGYTDFLSSIQSEHYIPSWTEDPFEVTASDRLLILSTCNNNDSQRFLVGAVLVKEQ